MSATPEIDPELRQITLLKSCEQQKQSTRSQYFPLADNQLVALAVDKMRKSDRVSSWSVMDLGLQ